MGYYLEVSILQTVSFDSIYYNLAGFNKFVGLNVKSIKIESDRTCFFGSPWNQSLNKIQTF